MIRIEIRDFQSIDVTALHQHRCQHGRGYFGDRQKAGPVRQPNIAPDKQHTLRTREADHRFTDHQRGHRLSHCIGEKPRGKIHFEIGAREFGRRQHAPIFINQRDEPYRQILARSVTQQLRRKLAINPLRCQCGQTQQFIGSGEQHIHGQQRPVQCGLSACNEPRCLSLTVRYRTLPHAPDQREHRHKGERNQTCNHPPDSKLDTAR